MKHFESPSIVTTKTDHTPAVSPRLDEPGCSTPTRTPVATVINHMINFNPSLFIAPKKKQKLITLEKAQEYLDHM